METEQAPALKTCVSWPRGVGEEFYSNDSMVRLLIRLGCMQSLHSFNLVRGDLLMSFSGSVNLVFSDMQF